MKLKNKKTGEIVSLDGEIIYDDKVRLLGHYNSLAELCEEWEDYEEPTEFWYIYAGKPQRAACGDILEKDFKSIGNHFGTKEETEKAIEKLKALKRLEDYGVRFCSWFYDIEKQEIKIKAEFEEFEEVIVGQNRKDLDLLFGGEE